MDLLSYWWLLLALPALFASGWALARLEARQRNLAAQRTRAAYLRGLAHLLDERQDQAIDAFIEAVDRDPHTTDLQFALASLFRRRGDYDRAVRLHENLISLPELSPEARDHAQFELGMDYFKAGLFDRTVESMAEVRTTFYRPRALEIILQVRERLRQWDAAVLVAQELEHVSKTSYARQISHYHCELASLARKQPRSESTLASWHEHLQHASHRPSDGTTLSPARPLLMLLAAASEDTDWDEVERLEARLRQEAPEYLGLAAQQLLPVLLREPETAIATRLRTSWQQWLEQNTNLDVLDAVLQLAPDRERDTLLLRSFVARPTPALLPRLLGSAATELTATTPANANELAQALGSGVKTLQPVVASSMKFRCAACSFESRHFFWQCPGCLGWETMPPRRLGDSPPPERS